VSSLVAADGSHAIKAMIVLVAMKVFMIEVGI
jgi:hypothetical protein